MYLSPNSIYYTFMVTAEGMQYVDNNNGKDGVPTTSLINEEPLASATTKFFTIIQDMQKKGQMASTSLDGATARQMFLDGEIAILSSTCSGLVAIGEMCNWEVEFGFHPAYTINAGAENYGQCVGGGQIYIGNNENPEKERGAWEFLKFLMNTENSVAFAMTTGYLPTTKSGFESDEYQAFVEEYFPTAIDSYEAQQNTADDCYNAFMEPAGRIYAGAWEPCRGKPSTLVAAGTGTAACYTQCYRL